MKKHLLYAGLSLSMLTLQAESLLQKLGDIEERVIIDAKEDFDQIRKGWDILVEDMEKMIEKAKKLKSAHVNNTYHKAVADQATTDIKPDVPGKTRRPIETYKHEATATDNNLEQTQKVVTNLVKSANKKLTTGIDNAKEHATNVTSAAQDTKKALATEDQNRASQDTDSPTTSAAEVKEIKKHKMGHHQNVRASSHNE